MKNEKTMVSVPYIAYEKEMEAKNKIIICLIITIILIVFMFMSFINKHDFTSYDQDGNGINNINSGTQGDVSNESTTKDNN